MKKKKSKGPRRKRMRRENSLQSAKHWILTYSGKNIIKGYRKWFGVDLLCALHELKLLCIKVDGQYVNQALKAREQIIAMRQEKKKREEKRMLEEEDFPFDSDENFYYIAGYTSGGFPYGMTWAEAAEQDLEDLF